MSDGSITIREYQRRAEETAGAGCGSWQRRVLIAALGLTGAAGEVADLIRHKFSAAPGRSSGQAHPVSDRHLADALGDVLWYLAELATALNLDLAAIAGANCAKLKARYPDGFRPVEATCAEPVEASHRGMVPLRPEPKP